MISEIQRKNHGGSSDSRLFESESIRRLSMNKMDVAQWLVALPRQDEKVRTVQDTTMYHCAFPIMYD